MQRQKILIIESGSSPGAPSPLLSDAIASAGHQSSSVTPDVAVSCLRETLRTDTAPDVVVLTASIDNPLTVARALRAIWQSGHIVFVRHPEDMERLRREIGRTLAIGMERSLVQADDPLLPKIIDEAVRSSERRKKLRTTLDRANLQITTHKSVDSLDYRRLLISEHYLTNFLAQAKDAIVGLDADLRILYWNPSAEQLFGMAADEAFKLTAHQLPCWTTEIEASIWKAKMGQSVETAEITCGLKTGDVIVEIAFSSVADDGGKVIGVSLFIRDVTARHRQAEAERTQLERLIVERTSELRKAELALHQAQKLEAIGKLTGGVAHDFNNILQVIGGNLELLTMMLAGQELALGRARNALAAVTKGAKLSSHLLSFARRQPLKPISTNLGRVLRDLDELLRRSLGEAVELETIIGGGLWNTMVDRDQIENVILNLAINARDAMDGSGKLTLELGNALLDERYASLHKDVVPGQYVMLAVSDTGCGMTPEIMERVFEPFFTTKGEGEGTGLGLSMAYGFVKQSEGHIKIYSELGNGTTIRVYLPRSHQAEERMPDVHTLSISGGTELILVVEDDAAVQAAVVDMLTELGYKILKASDAQSALSILQSGVKVDLLFTDVVMPGSLRSPELARQAKELLPDIRVLFTSGYTQNAIVHGGRLDPGVELLSKPYSRENLARKIRQILEK